MLQLPDERPYRNRITKNLCVFATKTGHFTIRFLNRQIYRIFSPSRAATCTWLMKVLERIGSGQSRLALRPLPGSILEKAKVLSLGHECCWNWLAVRQCPSGSFNHGRSERGKRRHFLQRSTFGRSAVHESLVGRPVRKRTR